MALTAVSLKAKMITKLTAAGANITDDAFLGAISEAIIEEITTNAVVPAGTYAAGGDPVTGSTTVT